ncbi:MAG: stage III sporulation protein AB [Firmicutes bacterium]|nr:stage III sporulation protein AB [Bacillota bacterium]
MIWLKLLGSALVLLSSGYLGLQMASAYRRRPRELAALRSGLQLLETEIVYGATPLPAALRQVAAGLDGTAGELFQKAGQTLSRGRGITGGEGWSRALGEVYPYSALTPEDLGALRLLGVSLGASDRADQVKHLALCRERLAHLEEQAKDRDRRYSRVWSYAGFLTGLLVVLVLI